MRIFLLLLIIPLIEISLFIQIGGAIGLFTTLAIIVGTAFLGSFLLKRQGVAALANLQNSFSSMRDPSSALAHGAMILVSAIFLITPGFLTDFFGFSLFIPSFRQWIINTVGSRMSVTQMNMQSKSHTTNKASHTVEGDYTIVSEDGAQSKRTDSKWRRY